ncbi:Uncharacterised protein [uncultured archaeon]|nr:Uncharacterised protein [uncultured archaeon]
MQMKKAFVIEERCEWLPQNKDKQHSQVVYTSDDALVGKMRTISRYGSEQGIDVYVESFDVMFDNRAIKGITLAEERAMAVKGLARQIGGKDQEQQAGQVILPGIRLGLGELPAYPEAVFMYKDLARRLKLPEDAGKLRYVALKEPEMADRTGQPEAGAMHAKNMEAML